MVPDLLQLVSFSSDTTTESQHTFLIYYLFLTSQYFQNSLFPTEFQDIHVMVFLGFGFLATFLVRYGFSSTGFSLLVAAMSVQWATILNGFLLSHSLSWKIRIHLKR